MIKSSSSPKESEPAHSFNWNPESDEMLKELHVLYQGSWKAISNRMQGPTPLDCLQRWQALHPEHSRTRQLWSPEEDEQLQELVQKHGKKWSKICTIMNWRTGKQVRERYLNQLQGTINTTKWTEEEDKLILKLYKKFGTKWSYISGFLHGRPENMVKNRFYANLRRRFQCDTEDSDESDLESVSSQGGRPARPKRKRQAQKTPAEQTEGPFTRMTRSRSHKHSEQVESNHPEPQAAESHQKSKNTNSQQHATQENRIKVEMETPNQQIALLPVLVNPGQLPILPWQLLGQPMEALMLQQLTLLNQWNQLCQLNMAKQSCEP